MDTSTLRRPLWALAGALLLAYSGLAMAEPPARAARLGYLSGTVSFSPAGQPDWVRAAINRPLTTGDRLWTGQDSRAELQIGGAAIRMGPGTSLVLLNLDDRIAQVQLSQGTLKLRVRSMGPRQSFEVATPNLAFTLRRAGEYRIEVDPNDDATAVAVQSGEAEVYGDGSSSYTVTSRRAYRFYGSDLSDYDVLTAQRDDDLDRWSRERDRRGDSSVSARYVSSEVVGYEDLDANGTWRVDATYGNVWTPRRVAAGWTPYRDGHWSWVDPWGWTWVDDAPWGYAVSHYGRWANIRGSWAWVPGPRQERAVYAPALVAFVGGKNFQVSVTVGSAMAAAVGWFPLAPREVYQPSYPVGRAYFDNINRSNAVIAPQTITKIYNTNIVTNNTTIVNNTTNVTNVIYANRLVTGAVVAVPAQAFVQSQPVAKATVRLAPEAVASAPVVRVASVAPVQQSVQGGAREAITRPPARERAVVDRTAPPPAPLPFAAQQQQLAAKPGTPIDEAQRTRLKPAAPAVEPPKVSVAATAPVPTPTALPPATPPAAKSPEARKAAAARPDGAPREGRKPVDDKTPGAAAEASKAEAMRAEAAKVDAARAASAKADALKAEEARAGAASAEAAKTASAKADAARAADAKAADAKAEAGKAANARADAARAEDAKAEKARSDAARAEVSKVDAMKAEAARSSAAKAAAAKAEAAKAEAANADASKAAAAQATAARGEAAKDAAAKADAAKAAETKAEASRAASAKAEAGKADEARAERARGEAAKAEVSKAEAMRAEAARGEAAKAAAAKAEAAKADAARAESNRAEAAKVAALKAESAKAEASKADAARGEAAKAGAARAEAAKAEAARADVAKAESAKADAAKAEAAKAAAVARAPAAAPPPRTRASGPKPEPESNAEDEKKKDGRNKP